MNPGEDPDLVRLRRELVAGGLVRPERPPWRIVLTSALAGFAVALLGGLALRSGLVRPTPPPLVARGGPVEASSRVGVRLFLAREAGDVREVRAGEPIVLTAGTRLLLSTTNHNEAAWTLALALVQDGRTTWLAPTEALAPRSADEPVDRDWAPLLPAVLSRGLLVAAGVQGALTEAVRGQLERCLPRGAPCPLDASIQRWSVARP